MLFRRSILKELAGASAGVFSVLLAITLTTLLTRLLGQAAGGSLESGAVLAFLGFSVLNYLPVLLSLTLFIAVLMTLSRSFRDSEMVVWFSSGLSMTAWIRPVMYFAAPLVTAIALLSLVLSPWAVRKSDELMQQIESRNDVSTVSPGVFKESRQTERVYFVEGFAGAQNAVRNIFVQSVEQQKLGVVVAQRGYQETAPNGDKFLVLQNGRRYEGKAGSPEYKIVEFQRYAMRIEPFEAKLAAPSSKSLSTPALLRDRTPANLAELQWRIGLPVSGAILALLAIPLSFVNPRAGRSLNLMLALLTYMVYSNLLSISQAWVAQQKVTPATGLWAVHAGMLAILLFLFYRRLYFAPSALFRRGRPKGSKAT